MKAAILHYSLPPVVGGVETVIAAHARLLLQHGWEVQLIAGRGEPSALPSAAQFIHIPLMDTRHREIRRLQQALEAGEVPGDFERLANQLAVELATALKGASAVLVHNIFTKHFNLALTAALVRLVQAGQLNHPIAWCHDLSWTSPHSSSSLHPGYPWDLLGSCHPGITYVAVSAQRRAELVQLPGCNRQAIPVVVDGVDPSEIFSLTQEGVALAERLDLLNADLVLLMPVRITQAKNIELALQVTARLTSSGIRPRLVITGPPDPHDAQSMAYYQSLLELRRQLGVEQEVRFVFASGAEPQAGYTIDLPVVRQLYRLADVLFLPSHREGFGMPILEAGLIGMPIFTTPIPAAQEMGEGSLELFSPGSDPIELTRRLLAWSADSPTQRLRRRMRQEFTWEAIYQHAMLPLLTRKAAP